jgi:multisubunit Na+/H+ antiporter MnhC subunit
MGPAARGYSEREPSERSRLMPNLDPVANVLVLVAAGIGAMLAVYCVVQILRHRDHETDTRLTQRRSG